MCNRPTCHCCGQAYDPGLLIQFMNEAYCSECYDRETVECSCCSQRIWSIDNYGDSETPLCQGCYDRYYTNCSSCGSLIQFDEAFYPFDDEDRPLCSDCYDRDEKKSKPIHDYYYKPIPVFHGSGPRFFGIELEIHDGGENSSNAVTVLS